MLAVHRNTRRLYNDALVLLENGRFPASVMMTILALEEAAKPLIIGPIGILLPVPPLIAISEEGKRLPARMWRAFEDHEHKNKMTLDMHLRVGEFPPAVREALEAIGQQAAAETNVRMRERATYVDCVQGAERWSVPDAVIDGGFALDLMRAARKSLGRIPTPAQVVNGCRKSDLASQVPRDRLESFRLWAESREAERLSETDIAEQREWIGAADAALTRIAGVAGVSREPGMPE